LRRVRTLIATIYLTSEWLALIRPLVAGFDRPLTAALLLNTRRRVRGHQVVSIGTMDTILVHPREVFRGAVNAAAAAIVIMHNHPSGEPEPSEADIKVTRDLCQRRNENGVNPPV
jgi:DNA repair protein RadC